MTDQFDVDLEDGDLSGEIELLIQLMIAVKPFEHHLSTAQVDVALGLGSRPSPDETAHPAARSVGPT